MLVRLQSCMAWTQALCYALLVPVAELLRMRGQVLCYWTRAEIGPEGIFSSVISQAL